MATSESPKPSSSSKPELKVGYDIFLSFRGSDTRKKFTDHLYHALTRKGFQTFRDDGEIEGGDVIKPESLKAIRNSRMSVIVLSKNYANSMACLYELQTILELCKKSDHFVLPVFYEVEPSVVKEQSKNLDFEKKEVTTEKVKAWSAVLKEAASMAGMVKESDSYEAKFIEEIVGELKGKLALKHRSVDNHLVGMDSRTERVNCWLKDRSSGVGILSICGMGGIGKTTIAKVVYNSNHHIFDAACFLENVSGVSKGHIGLVDLQRHFLSDTLGKNEHIDNVDDGREQIKYALSDKRILLVLDDVDQMDQLFALVGQQDWFSPGSKIIITTRIESMMNANENCEVYRPENLSNDESLELFSWHAFGQKQPIEGHMDLLNRFLQLCDGLPLALQVLGSSVRWKNRNLWESELQKLEESFDITILKKLEISYDSIKDNRDKNLFLDIACFFVGKKKNETITILEGCDYDALGGIHNLVDRNLLTIVNEKLQMHSLHQVMGKHIVFRESNYLEMRSRIWYSEESFKILQKKMGTEKIEGLALDMNMLKNSNMVVFEANSFEKMDNLRLLKMTGVKLSGTYKAFPKRLRWLYWRGFPSESLPNNFPLENLVSLDMRYSNLKRVWKGTKVLGSLRILNLSHSEKLAKTPNFSRIPNLEKLILKACLSLFEVDESIAKLQRIQSLNLQDCTNLRKLPRYLGMVESLVEINISGCSNLMGAIEELEKMKSLQVLNAAGMDVNRVLTVEVVSHAFIWPWVPKPRVQMSLASLPSSLVRLDLSYCNLTEDAFPRDLSKLSKLEGLKLSGNPFSSLPNFIKDLTDLQTLELSRCPKLQQIHWSSTRLEWLIVGRCDALKKITFETESCNIRTIDHMYCPNLNHIEGKFKISPVREVDVELLNSIGFFNLDSMADVEAKLLNVYSGMIGDMVPIQILYQDHTFHAFFPGREVPQWFSKKNGGSNISFTTTLSPHFGFQGLNLCAVYTLPEDEESFSCDFYFEINNKSSGMKTVCRIYFYCIPENGGDMVWLSHCSQAHLFTEGDEVEVSFMITRGRGGQIEGAKFICDGQIKECGVHLLYFEEEVEVYQHVSTIQRSWDPNLSLYEPEAGLPKLAAQNLYAQDPKSRGKEDLELLQLQVHQYSDPTMGTSGRGSTSGNAPEEDEESLNEVTESFYEKFSEEVSLEELEDAPSDPQELEDFNCDPLEVPPTLSHHFSILQELNLSYTEINSLPQSISRLVALRKLVLRNCELLMELPPEIGELTNLEVLDLEGTEMLCLPKEIAKLVNLTCLKVSFHGYANQTVIPRRVLSSFSRLNELIIDVTPYGEWWDDEVKAILGDLCRLKELRTLKLYLPTAELLEDLKTIFQGLANFRFTVGRHEEHFISRLPHDVEEEFNNREKLEKGLKYINGTSIPNEITKVLKHANAFFLQCHWTAKSLSEFGHVNMIEVKFCLVMECNELRTIIDSEQFYRGKDGRGESAEIVLGSLERLIICYLKDMESIWKGPIGKGSLSNLKSLALHTCLKLTTLFTVDMLINLTKLEELIIHDCSKIDSLVSLTNSGSNAGLFLPSLKKISLLQLPELINISSGLRIAPNLERMVIFYCPKLEKLSTMDVSSTKLKVIKGEKEWWDALKWYESDLSKEHEDYLASLFIPLRMDGDLMAQLTKE